MMDMRIINEFQTETVIRKSRFLCILTPVTNEKEARDAIADTEKKYRDATHVCYAYVIGKNSEISRSSDNGEPAGTAGIPILEALKKSGLTYVCACVVRWFGGIKLGAGGLVRAYGGITSQACAACEKGIEAVRMIYEVKYGYDLQGSLETWLRANCEIREMFYDEKITAVVAADPEGFAEKITSLSRGEAEYKPLREETVILPSA